MSGKLLTACLGLMLCVFAASAAEKRKSIIAIVGANVHPTDGTAHLEPCEPEVPGGVLLDGARLALDAEPQDLRDLIELKSWDDGGCPETAKNIARQLTSDPRVLAVIGHATSSTTRDAALYYAQAGIPLLAPMATSPIVLFPYWPQDQKTQFANVFRLPPGDLQVQGPAVAYVVTSILGAKRFMIVYDRSPGARGYSEPLVRRIAQFLPKEVPRIELASSMDTFDQAADEVLRNQPDLVIFCGYPSTFQPFVEALRKKFIDRPSPTLLLTDGASSKNLNVGSFKTYLTYPVPNISAIDFPELRSDILENKHDGYEIYAYDAIRILAKAIRLCQSNRRQVSRSYILDELRNKRPLIIGAAGLYSFVDGENPLSGYSLYDVFGTEQKYHGAIEPYKLQKFIQEREQ